MMRLYRAPFSTNVERVALAPAHKGLRAESVWISYDDRSAVERASGQPLVPVLEFDEGVVVFDSMRAGARGALPVARAVSRRRAGARG